MEEIVQVHFPDIKDTLLRGALKTFYVLREIDELRKKPSTSELIDWIRALIAGGIPHENISSEVPFIGTLLKKEQDYDYFATNYMTRIGNTFIARRI
jgi:MoxR-like ATPase